MKTTISFLPIAGRELMHLITPEHAGAYALLIGVAWEGDGTIPTDPIRLARICGVSTRSWNSRFAPTILPLFEETAEGKLAPISPNWRAAWAKRTASKARLQQRATAE